MAPEASIAPTSADLPASLPGWLVFGWGVGGVALILLSPIVRLGAVAVDAVRSGLTPTQWGVAAIWCVFMLYAEGWRGFHKQFSPRVVVRALALASSRPLVPSVLAPFTCMGLLHATRKRRIVAWSLLTGIVILIVAVRQLPAPWRGIVDLGVVLGLSAGLTSIAWYALQALTGNAPAVPSDMPHDG
jgi:hypothetical protein